MLAVLGSMLTALTAHLLWAFWQGLTVDRYTIETDAVSSPVRIAVIADLHNTRFGENQSELIQKLNMQKPDVVLFPGDLDDSGHANEGSQKLLAAIGKEYPCYYVTGNHEFWTGRADTIVEMVRSYGVTVLAGDSALVEANGQQIRICGVDDPDGFSSGTASDAWQAQFARCRAETGDGIYTILVTQPGTCRPLCRQRLRPRNRRACPRRTGAHSPFAERAVRPLPGLVSKYAGGHYALGTTDMIVSRGLQNIPRIFNPPELVIIDLVPDN